MSKAWDYLLALVGLFLILVLFISLLYGLSVPVGFLCVVLVSWVAVVLMYYVLTWWFSRRT